MRSIDELTDAGIAALRAALARGDASSPVAVIIDRAVTDPLEDVLPSDEASMHVVHIRHDDLAAERMPYLLWLNDERRAERLLNRTVRLAMEEALGNVGQARQVRSVCGWIEVAPAESLQPAEGGEGHALAAGIANASVARSPSGERRLLRYIDPRVLARLSALARPGQLRHLLGPVAAWHFVGPDLSLRTLRVPLQAKPEVGFDAAQWAALGRMAWVNELVPQAAGWGLERTGEDLVLALDAQLARAQAAGLRTDTDCMTFATCALCVHERFDEHPAFAQALANSRSTGQSFADAAAALDETTLETIADGRWLSSQGRNAHHG